MACAAHDEAPRRGGSGDGKLPLISVVVPSFEQHRFIERTLRSILDQRYPRLEILVIDGGSSDGTLEILQRYRASYPQVLSFVSESDRSHAHAVNKGFKAARGELIGWLNSDDTYEPGALHCVARAFRENRSWDLAYGHGYYISEHDRRIGPYPSVEQFDWDALADVCYICQPSVFMRRRVIDHGHFLDDTMDYCCDYDYWIRLGPHFKIGFIEKHLANARIHVDAKSIRARRELIEEAVETVQKHYRYLPVTWALALAHERTGTGTPDPPLNGAGNGGPPAPTSLRTYLTAAALCVRGNLTRPDTWPRLATDVGSRAAAKLRRAWTAGRSCR